MFDVSELIGEEVVALRLLSGKITRVGEMSEDSNGILRYFVSIQPITASGQPRINSVQFKGFRDTTNAKTPVVGIPADVWESLEESPVEGDDFAVVVRYDASSNIQTFHCLEGQYEGEELELVIPVRAFTETLASGIPAGQCFNEATDSLVMQGLNRFGPEYEAFYASCFNKAYGIGKHAETTAQYNAMQGSGNAATLGVTEDDDVAALLVNA